MAIQLTLEFDYRSLFSERAGGEKERTREREKERERRRERESEKERGREREREREREQANRKGHTLKTGGEDAYDALNCRSLSAKELLITGLFCGK